MEKQPYIVNRESCKDICKEIIPYINGEKSMKQIIDNGEKMLNSYPTIIEKVKREITFVERVYEAHS